MKEYNGILRKMKSALKSPVEYQLVVGDALITLNQYLQHKITIHFAGTIYCIQCARKIKKTFQQGLCFPCMQRLNECGNCAIFPERCLVEQGTCPKDDWAHAQCAAPQIIYLANASGLKVGITRETQVPTRWMDQGAIQALPIFKASNRYRSGLMEVALKAFVSDRTNWRVMLKNEVENIDMVSARERLLQEAYEVVEKTMTESGDAIAFIVDSTPVDIQYPVIEYPNKITSLSLDKQPKIEGVLMGIKGQYLLLDTGVLNVRKFGGYEVGVRITSYR